MTFWKRQSYEVTNQWLPRAGSRGRGPQTNLRELFGVMQMFYTLTVVMVMLLYAFAQTHQTTYFTKGRFYYM